MEINDGIINVYKKKGFTSHDVVAIVRGATRKKCGHTGTLDPDAEGVLPICLGRATKLAERITAGRKEYEAEIIFGAATDTQDASGAVTARQAMELGEREFNDVLSSFVGEYSQVPPMYSAVKQKGKKLYELARAGIEVVREPRLVHIYSIGVIELKLPETAKIRVCCSKGTYIRTLCDDIGRRLGGFAHMGGLVRTRSGAFDISRSFKVDEIKKRVADGSLNDIIIAGEELEAYIAGNVS